MYTYIPIIPIDYTVEVPTVLLLLWDALYRIVYGIYEVWVWSVVDFSAKSVVCVLVFCFDSWPTFAGRSERGRKKWNLCFCVHTAVTTVYITVLRMYS